MVWLTLLNASARTLKEAHLDLALNEERLRIALTGGGIGTWRYEIDSKRVFCSDLFCALSGLPYAPVFTLDQVLSTIYPEDRPMVEAAVPRTYDFDTPYAWDYRVLLPDGTQRWLASRGKCFADELDGTVRLEGILQDVSERRFSGVQTKLLAAIVESSDDAIYTKDLNGIVTTWNPGAERIYGYSGDEIVGQSIRILGVSGRHQDFDEVMEKVSQGQFIEHFQTQRRAKNGKIIDVSLTVSPIRDQNGTVTGISSIARDITELRAVEDQLRQSQKMEAVGRLAGGVAHDFNNLVMVINSYAQLIKDYPSLNWKLEEYAQNILEAGTKAAAVTRQLLAFSRKQVQDLKIIDLNDLALRFCEMLPRFIGEDIHLEVKPRTDSAFVFADRGQLEQILMNLVVNARDAMPKGGKLAIAVDTATIAPDSNYGHAVSLSPGGYATLSVRDNGIGMTAETQARIFEPFFTTKELGKGTGLGLATVYGIVKQHKGMVWVYSEPGLGTEFKIYLPFHTGTADVSVAPTGSKVEGGMETILLVEDERALRNVIGEYLLTLGYNVLSAENGDVALRLSATCKGHIDLILADFILPGLRGLEVAAKVLDIHPNARVILMSGYADRDLAAGDEQLKYHFVQKPLDLRLLAQQIRMWLVQSAERIP
ncbi:MAG: PAS domain S-box protein [Candidatus Acidiferrum sp.]